MYASPRRPSTDGLWRRTVVAFSFE